MKQKSSTRPLAAIATIIFLSFLAFWSVIALKGLQGDSDTAELFSALYGIMALFGGIVGITIGHRWGGFKSLIGKALIFMSLGLLSQEAGQITYSAYTYLFHQEIPYPSLGDVGYFGSVIFYILATVNLVRALSVKKTTGTLLGKFWLTLLPVVLLIVSYAIFLRSYTFDSSQPVTIFLDFGYPFGQAFYIALVLAVFVLSKRYLGGVMKPAILFLILTLVAQYAADFTFLYQTHQETWQTAGINELMYLTAYFLMTLSLLKFGAVLDGLRQKNES